MEDAREFIQYSRRLIMYFVSREKPGQIFSFEQESAQLFQ